MRFSHSRHFLCACYLELNERVYIVCHGGGNFATFFTYKRFATSFRMESCDTLEGNLNNGSFYFVFFFNSTSDAYNYIVACIIIVLKFNEKACT